MNALLGNIVPILLALAALVFAAIGSFFFIRARKSTARKASGPGYDASAMLRDYSLAISNIVDVEQLASVAVGFIRQAMGIERGFLFLVNKEAGQETDLVYRLVGVGESEDWLMRNGTLSGSSPIVRYFMQARKPLLQEALTKASLFQAAPPDEREWLSALEMEAYVPICSKNEWIGLLALGAKSSGRSYSESDLNLLTTFASQSAVALENARLVDNLTRLNQELRQAYQSLDQANRGLERLEQTKSDFISIASHELRTPLTVMRGYTEMLLEDPSLRQNASLFQIVSGIHKGILRLDEIVESMFDITRLDSRVADLNMQPVDLPGLIQSVCRGLEEAFRQRRQTLTLKLPAMPVIQADAETLRKVIHHLLTNAIKFTPDGGSVTISGRVLSPNQHDLPEGGVEIVVSDTGVGVDPANRELIFAKFSQQEEDLNKHSTGRTKFKGAGAGLGLSLARSVVEAHGGRIWVESPGYDEAKCPGSQFHVVLPIRHQRESATVRMEGPVKLRL